MLTSMCCDICSFFHHAIRSSFLQGVRHGTPIRHPATSAMRRSCFRPLARTPAPSNLLGYRHWSNSRWTLGSALGSGSFAAVHAGHRDGVTAAVKVSLCRCCLAGSSVLKVDVFDHMVMSAHMQAQNRSATLEPQGCISGVGHEL